MIHQKLIEIQKSVRALQRDAKAYNYNYVSGDKLQVVDIPCGYTHNIENVGDGDMVTVMWANEAFDPAHPDTFALPV